MKRAADIRQETLVTSLPALTRQRTRAMDKASAAIAASLLTAMLLTGCTAGTPAATGPSTTGDSSAAQGTATPTETSAAVPSVSAPTEGPGTAAMKQTVTDALGRLAAGTPKPATAQVTAALTGAGVAPAALEVSASRTPTGLEADAIESAVLQGTDCVFGQIRDGSVSVTVLPVLASGKCFVGAPA
ncbi:DUF6993 domain-containing protein [Pseudarthrobacter sulfonivorans]|uniref:DUF6993 domain-containing protein n=1 Tax=Pseudarthrobacter sulfonivorans TaxID=121292 RepID=UPI0021075B72|nr:hypothetical protein [Pseudarthrobacter sulfonivorans]